MEDLIGLLLDKIVLLRLQPINEFDEVFSMQSWVNFEVFEVDLSADGVGKSGVNRPFFFLENVSQN